MKPEHRQLLSRILYEEVPHAAERLQNVKDLSKMEGILTAKSKNFLKLSGQKASLTSFVARGITLIHLEIHLSF